MTPRFALLTFLYLAASGVSADALDSVERRIQAGHHAVALLELERTGSSSDRARFLKATALAGAGQTEDAIALYRTLIKERPALPEPYNNLAALYARMGRLEEAKDILEQGIRTRESYATIYENLSTVYVEMARDSYVKALRLEDEVKPPKLQLITRLGGGSPVPIQVASTEPAAITPVAVIADPAPNEKAPEPALAPTTPQPVAESEPSVQVARVEAPQKPNTAPAPPLEQILLAALERWAIAWSDRDVDRYLDAYAPDYLPEDGSSRAAWEAERRQRLTRPAWIKVELNEITVDDRNAGEVTVSVVQDYEAPNYRDRTHKAITLVERDGRWLIREEKSLKTQRR